MPYIKVDKRVEFEQEIDAIVSKVEVHGDLNYVLSTIAARWLLHKTGGRPRYQDRQNLLGTLRHVEHEFARRALDNYEDGAIETNRDMPEYVLLDGPLPPE